MADWAVVDPFAVQKLLQLAKFADELSQNTTSCRLNGLRLLAIEHAARSKGMSRAKGERQ